MSRPKPKGGPVRRFFRFVGRWTRRVVLFLLGLGLAGIAAAGWLYQTYILDDPGPHLERSYIEGIIAAESPIFYADEESRLGVLFAGEHREYLRYRCEPDEANCRALPQRFIDALVAAEDKNFFSHPGLDPMGIARAMRDNVRAGRVVAGGSSLTQQTAKNLYGRAARDLNAKLIELINALRLEARYSKGEILEFYSNQFFVNGNGRGLGIAARFFFDKEPAELDLLECAFLAGVVKSPNSYNPFVSSDEGHQAALRRAHERVDYVLGRMHIEGMITVEQLERERARAIPFRRGRFQYEQSVAMDLIAEELEEEPIASALAGFGIADPRRAGLRIISTLERDVQEGAVYALRHSLTETALTLEAPETAALVLSAEDRRALPRLRRDTLRPGQLLRAEIIAIDTEQRTIELALGGDVSALLDTDGLRRINEALVKGREGNRWARIRDSQIDELLAGIEVGQQIRVSLRDPAAEPLLVDWEWRGELDGAAVALDGGRVVAMAGGFDNTNFNRAASAYRQFGSTWKLLIYYAALQLGWAPTDPLDNSRAVYPYQGVLYHPRPDHRGAPARVSMVAAGTYSENLASIYLLYHLTDRLNREQLREVAQLVGMLPTEGESIDDFITRLRDELGILPTAQRRTAGLWERARERHVPDLIFAGREDEAWALRTLDYGLGFEGEEERTREGSQPASEKTQRLLGLRRSFLRQQELLTRYEGVVGPLQELLSQPDGEPLAGLPAAGLRWRCSEGGALQMTFGERFEADDWQDFDRAALVRAVAAPLCQAEGEEPEGGEPEGSETEGDEPEGEVGSEGVSSEGSESEVGEPDKEQTSPDSDSSARRPRPRFAPNADGTGIIALPGDGGPLERLADRRRREREAAQREQARLGRRQLRRALDPGVLTLEEQLSPASVRTIVEYLEAERESFGSPEPWSFDDLSILPDYRILIGIRYVIELARRAGMESPITPVLSLPLGSSDVTLLEMASVYQLFRDGQHHWYGSQAHPSLIQRVELPDGTPVYEAEAGAEQVVDSAPSAVIGQTLRSVVQRGTGQRAARAVALDPTGEDGRVRGQFVPLMGKTGTTNNYQNAAFIGFVPQAPEGGGPPRFADSFTVASYVGYDDNRAMRNGNIRIAGASGALPVWIGVADALARHAPLGPALSASDLAFSGGQIEPLWGEDLDRIRVYAADGLLPHEWPSEDPEAAQMRLLAPEEAEGLVSPVVPDGTAELEDAR